MLKIDLHIHTIASGHAYNTILEYINQARKNKMKVIGFTDHGPEMDETIVSKIYFGELNRIPKIVDGVRVLKGVEANISDGGGVDLPDLTLQKLDYAMAGLHKGVGFNEHGVKGNTAALIKTIKSGKIKIITHPFKMEAFKTDVEAVAAAACINNVLLEINVSYLKEKQLVKHPENLPELKKMLKIVKKYNKKVIVGSDAHCIWELGDDAPLEKIKKRIGLTDKMIINNYPKELFKLLNIKS